MCAGSCPGVGMIESGRPPRSNVRISRGQSVMPKIGGHLCRLQADDVGVGSAREFRVARVVVAVAMRVRDHQRDRGATMLRAPFCNQPVDRRPDFEIARSAVEQQRSVAAEQEVEERAFEIRPYRLADHEGVGIVLLNLHFRFGFARTVDPRGERRLGIRFRHGRTGTQRQRQREGNAGRMQACAAEFHRSPFATAKNYRLPSQLQQWEIRVPRYRATAPSVRSADTSPVNGGG